ncbi:MAG: PadR family transcriptional regulator [Gemmatimonadetes bacterium]|nr:PadR family transcriptional regulator [Gemmatimonadota bacterium]
MRARPRNFGFAAWSACCGPEFRWRFFDRGDLKYVILRLLSRKPMHGYEVMRALEEESCGCYRASPGSVYPTLQMLEDQGYVLSEEREGKKVYRITEEGRQHLEENRDVVEDIFERVSDFTGHFFRADMRDLTRSFSRLAQVTFERAMRWRADAEVLARMKEILDRAVREMESAGGGPSGAGGTASAG